MAEAVGLEEIRVKIQWEEHHQSWKIPLTPVETGYWADALVFVEPDGGVSWMVQTDFDTSPRGGKADTVWEGRKKAERAIRKLRRKARRKIRSKKRMAFDSRSRRPPTAVVS